MSQVRVLARKVAAGSSSLGSVRWTHAAAADGPMSFIDRAKKFGANAMLGLFVANGGRFDRVAEGLKVEAVDSIKGSVTCSLTVHEGVLNGYGTLHGGATTTLVDIVGTMALLARDATKPGVSVELNTTFIAAAKKGDVLRIEGRVLKSGRTLGFTTVDIWGVDKTGAPALVATGRHVKALGS